MPAGMTIPAMQMQQPAIGGVNGGVSGYGPPPPPPSSSSSGLLLGQHSSMSMNMGKNHMNMNLMEGHHHIHELHPLEMPGGGPGHQSPSEGDLGLIRDEEYESRSGGSDNHDQDPSGEDEQDPNQTLPVGAKRKRYHRHTQHQIQEMENFFKRNPHPDDKQRKILGFELGLEPLQVKFWFQNKRTQMKTHQERSENTVLRAENEKLRVENIRYREAISAISCPNCGGPSVEGDLSFDEQQLRVENNHLREEIDRISTIAARYVGRPLTSYAVTSPRPLELGFGNPSNIGDDMIIRPRDADKPIIIDLAVAAMDEVMRMAHMEAPLWVPAGVNDGGTTIVLNMDEYMRTFPRGIGPRPDGFRYEASREAAIVIMNHIDLVEVFMDVYKWSTVFAGIISRASTLDVLSTGVAGNYNGALQVMSAEIQVPTPVVSTREIYFVRYCKQQGEGTWVIADVSIDGLHPGQVSRCRRRPSGCIIQEMPNGYSKVTWVDHVEVEDRGIHDIYKAVVHSGLAFGAKRWISTLDRQCERIARAMATNIHPNDVFNIAITNPDGRRSMLKLAERMVLSFCQGVSASTAHTWTTLSGSGADDVRVMTRKSIDDPGRPPGIVLCAATSFWLPVPPKPVFDFVRDENSRNEWDILSSGGMVQEIAHIAYGHETGNCISLLRVNSNNSTQTNMLIIEESFTDPTGSYVIYAPVDTMAMNVVLGGGNPDYVALLPSGFAIMPDGTSTENADHGSSGGSLMTVAFQILVDSVPSAKLSLGSVATVNNLITMTVDRIKASLAGDIS